MSIFFFYFISNVLGHFFLNAQNVKRILIDIKLIIKIIKLSNVHVSSFIMILDDTNVNNVIILVR